MSLHELSFVSMADGHAVAERTEDAAEEEEEERVVYYDLDDSSRRAHAASRADATLKRSAKAAAASAPKQRVLERPTQLFASHAALGIGGALEEDDDDDDDDTANPFAALLQAKPPPKRKNVASPSTVRRSPVTRVTPPSASPPSPTCLSRAVPRAKRSLSPEAPVTSRRTPPLPRAVARSSRGAAPRPLVPTFEAADARPARWTRNAPASGTTKRRQSTSSAAALAKQQAEAKRRKSMPPSVSSLDESYRPSTLTGGRRLSEVLSKATLLSQERTPTSRSVADHSFEYSEPTRETDDGIADTAKEMRDEPFQTQFFSPSKLRNGGSSSHRKPRADAVLAKIRGSLGDAIRKATRKTNRDLTLLRSQGQTLLARADQDSAGDVHSRDFVVVQLDRLLAHQHLVTYDGIIHDLRLTNDSDVDVHGVAPTEGMKLTIVFSASDATQQLTRGSQIKIFAPFQVVEECFVPGVRRRRRKFLIGTSLFELAGSDP